MTEDIDVPLLRKLVATEQMDEEAFGALIDAYERLRAQVVYLTRIAGCVAVGKELADIKREIKDGISKP